MSFNNPMASKKISIIIPLYNRGNWLEEAVQSILLTNYPNVEILIVDDESTDNSIEVARELASKYKGIIRLLQHLDRENHGPGGTRNLGIQAAQGQYICFLDSDDYLFPHRFETSVEILDSDSTVDAVFESTKTEILAGGEERSRQVRPVVSFDCEDHQKILDKILKEHRHWSVNAILIRKSILEKVGGFSERLRGCEDLVLWLKLSCLAKLVKGSEIPVAAYRIHARNSYTYFDVTSQVINPLQAYLEVFRWSKKNRIDFQKRQILGNAVLSKLIYACSVCRSNGQPRTAIISLLQTFPYLPSVALKKAFWGNLFYSLCEMLELKRNSRHRT